MSKDLKGTIREQRGSAANRRLRAEGFLPGIIYGQEDPVSITVNHKDLRKLIEAYGINTLINLSVESDSVPKRTVIVKDHQSHPIREGWEHVDFYEVDMTEKIKTVVPILLDGKSPAEKLGGIVEQSLDELHIRCLPGDIPHDIKVDMTKVEMDQVVHVSDLPLPAGIEVIDDPEEAVVSIHEVKEEVEAPEGEEALVGEEAEAGEKAADEGEGGKSDS
ncbi:MULTISPECIES: 50S ribosomal protein L25 [unclassified Nitrospina]|uniref:50S ribosomal protein L25 n=1 Tax=unclassified Nitrospina TaxID=2638683 RepID=UPI003F9DA8FC